MRRLALYAFVITLLWLGFVCIGLSQGVFALFTMYLPPLFPTLLRTTGAGFCYNIGRVLASVGPFLVGAAAAHNTAMQSIFYVGFVPLVALLFVPGIIETRGQPLSD